MSDSNFDIDKILSPLLPNLPTGPSSEPLPLEDARTQEVIKKYHLVFRKGEEETVSTAKKTGFLKDLGRFFLRYFTPYRTERDIRENLDIAKKLLAQLDKVDPANVQHTNKAKILEKLIPPWMKSSYKVEQHNQAVKELLDPVIQLGKQGNDAAYAVVASAFKNGYKAIMANKEDADYYSGRSKGLRFWSRGDEYIDPSKKKEGEEAAKELSPHARLIYGLASKETEPSEKIKLLHLAADGDPGHVQARILLNGMHKVSIVHSYPEPLMAILKQHLAPPGV